MLWEHLLASSREFDLKPYGVEAMQSLRIEKGYPLYGPDISEEYTPFHVGLGRWIRFESATSSDVRPCCGFGRGLENRWIGLTLESEVPALPGRRSTEHRQRRRPLPGDGGDRRRGWRVRGRADAWREAGRTCDLQRYGAQRRQDACDGLRGDRPTLAGQQPRGGDQRPATSLQRSRQRRSSTLRTPGQGRVLGRRGAS